MDAARISISPAGLYRRLGTATAPLVLDVRRLPAFAQSDRMIVSAVHRDPAALDAWKTALPRGRAIALYCVHGHEVSQNAAAELRALGLDAFYLEGGIEGWQQAGLPTRRKSTPASATWVTRERPKIDRIACPWLIGRFIDPEATFVYVPSAQVMDYAKAHDATPYDVDGVAFGHEDERCTFDTILRRFDIHDAALGRLAAIVRGADTARLDLAPQAAGLLAVSLGLSANFADDHAMLAQGLVVYDALYAWCRTQ